MKRGGDKRLSVFGAKDNVRQEVRVGVGHVLSPLRGLGGFYSNSSPTACAMGYDLSPASRAANRGRYRNASKETCRLRGLRSWVGIAAPRARDAGLSISAWIFGLTHADMGIYHAVMARAATNSDAFNALG